jgi:hypothetical protein
VIALTLHQPWATLVALGHKRLETRDWEPPISSQWMRAHSLGRSVSSMPPLAIHAGKAMTEDGRELFYRLRHRGIHLGADRLEDLPRGAVVAVGRLAYCYHAEFLTGPGRHIWHQVAAPLEELLGDFSAGRFAWLLSDVRPVRPPVSCRGFQRLWRLPDDVAATLAARGLCAA